MRTSPDPLHKRGYILELQRRLLHLKLNVLAKTARGHLFQRLLKGPNTIPPSSVFLWNSGYHCCTTATCKGTAKIWCLSVG
jgi:hypothetical protein